MVINFKLKKLLMQKRFENLLNLLKVYKKWKSLKTM